MWMQHLSIPREASVINEIETQCTPVKVRVIQVQTEHPIMIDKQVQVSLASSELISARLEIKALKVKLDKTTKSIQHNGASRNFSTTEIENNEKKCCFYTGLTWLQFPCLWRFSGPSAENLKYYRGESNRENVYPSPQEKFGKGRP
jgi:hypothetical protein